MGKFLSGLGMGMVAGACVGLAAAGMMSEADRRQMKRKRSRANDCICAAKRRLSLFGR